MRGWLLALVLLTLLRLYVAYALPLTPDEAYYWVWSRALAPGYLDHPPMVAWWIWVGTHLAGDSTLGVRLLAPFAAFAGTLAVCAAARDLMGEEERHSVQRVMVMAGGLLNATLALGVGAVTMTPDTPLLFFLAAVLWAFGRLFVTQKWLWWLLIGVILGLGLQSKYTTLLSGFGLVLWLFFWSEGRRWLKTPGPWVAGFLSALVFFPVIGWNAHHHWASFLKQGGRTGAWQPQRALHYIGELVGGQAGLATPLVFVAFVCGIVGLLRVRSRAGGLLLCLVMVPAFVFIEHALGDRVQANWPAMLYPFAAVAAAWVISWQWWRVACGLGMAVAALVYGQALWAPFALPGRMDVTLRQMGGWAPFMEHIKAVIPPREVVLADEYGLAAQLAYGLEGYRVVGVEPRWALFNLSRSCVQGPQRGLLVRTQRRKDRPDPALFEQAVPVGEIERSRKGQRAESYTLYRVLLSEGALRHEGYACLPHPRR